MSDEIIIELFVWAHRYKGYERMAGNLEALETLLEPAHRHYQQSGEVPEWCGVDLLRGWLFALARTERIWGSDPDEWLAVERALLAHPAARPEDVPIRGLYADGEDAP